MVRALREGGIPPVDWIVPVPTTPGRLKERGFNPARRLAEGLGEALGIPVVDALGRPAEAPRQVGLPPSQRAANVKTAFIVEGVAADAPRPPQVLLVDDVLTTGATVAAAAESLSRAGMAWVGVLTFARAAPGAPGS
jgi:predicted amidophosphoribosyltransferase